MDRKEKKALKVLANCGLQLEYEHVNPTELISEVEKLPTGENIIIELAFGFIDDCRDIEGCATNLNISIEKAKELLSSAKKMLLSQKDKFYHSNMSFIKDYEDEICVLENLNVRSYYALIKAGKKYIIDIEKMSIDELLTLPGLKDKDYQIILLTLEEYRKNNKSS